MSTIRSADMLLLDDLFDMGSGYVLNFSDRTMAQFFVEELNLDIYDPAYAKDGTSKAKRLRCFLRTADNATAERALTALWTYRGALRERSGATENVPNAEGKFLDLLNRIRGNTTSTTLASGAVPPPAFDIGKLIALRDELVALNDLAPHPRGYAFERFLFKLFDAYRMAPREPFRLVGEQIDGSFQLSHETYLLEAKWQNAKTDAAALRAFHGKLEEKAAWTRGLFVSYSGFTEDGLQAFGRGKRLVCMDGYDLWEMLNQQLPLNVVLERKVRKAAETGSPFARVRDLFPGR